MHEVKLENYKKYGDIYRERLGPGISMVQLFRPDDIAAMLRQTDLHQPHRMPLPITRVSNRREGFRDGLGDL